jgi:sensor histidine kinase YesM
MKKNLLSIKFIVLYALIAGLLMSLTPISLAFLPNRHGPSNTSIQMVDAFVIFLLNSVLFFSSLWVNLQLLDKTVIKKVTFNLLAYFLLCFFAIMAHRPVWMMLERLPISFFIRDEFIRNFLIFSISIIVAQAFETFWQNQQMKNKIMEIQRESLSGQIESLKQQINPHFFFNSLNTLSGLAQENSQKTVEFIEKLSMVFRYVLEIQEKNLVTITEELNFAKAYIYLLKVRFADKFIIYINVPEGELELIPSLCTQLLLENCFKHNGMSNQHPLRIEILKEPGFLVVRNSISPMNNSGGTKIGLKNLNERSRLLTGQSIIIETIDNNFSVKIPTLQ